MRRSPIPLVYLDSAVYLHVIKREPLFWAPALQVLKAARRGDIRLLSSALVLVELAGWKGDVDRAEQQRIVDTYLLANTDITWVDIDAAIAQEARPLALQHHLRGADATHLAVAIRHSADYFMSTDRRYPYGSTIETVKILRPEPVWHETVEDLAVQAEAAQDEADRAAVSEP